MSDLVSALRTVRRPTVVPPDRPSLRAHLDYRLHQPRLRRLAHRVRRRQDDRRPARPPHPSLRAPPTTTSSLTANCLFPALSMPVASPARASSSRRPSVPPSPIWRWTRRQVCPSTSYRHADLPRRPSVYHGCPAFQAMPTIIRLTRHATGLGAVWPENWRPGTADTAYTG